jgi:hypothetical protein
MPYLNTFISMHVTPDFFFLAICLLASLVVFFQAPPEMYFRVFPFYFAVAITVQFLEEYLARHQIHNVLLINLFSVSEYVFYFFVLREIITSARMKELIRWLIFIFPVFAIGYIFLFLKPDTFHSITYSIGCILISGLCIFYFYELFQHPTSTTLLKEPSFWICTSVLFSYVCTFPLWSMMSLFRNPSGLLVRNILIIQIIINIFSYLLIIIAFLCRIRIRKFTS